METGTTTAQSVPKIMTPQENRTEVDWMITLMNEQKSYVGTTEQWAMKIFMQGMAFQQTLTAVGKTVVVA